MVVRQPIPFQAFVFGFLRLIRVQNLLIVVLTQFLARIFLVGPEPDSVPTHWLRILTDPTIWLLSLSTVFIAAAGYIINDYFDVKIDLVNKPDRVVIGRYLKRRVAIGAHQLLSVIGCLIGLYLSRWVFVIDVISVSLLWFYSAQFKRQPLIGNIVISLLTALSFIVLAVYYRQNAQMLLIYALFSFGISLIREIIKDMQDIRGDARFGCRTLPIIWGLRRTKYLLYVLIGAFVLTLFLIADSLGNHHLTISFGLLLLPLAFFTYRLVLADTRRDFGYLSTLCKFIMLMGVMSMMWA
ncbi:geranylgeranylglycerol-phosphate geranylgeranyltransferase [Spirosoma utsteinense]|uniref:4-hydroxybenzoate polyprenyltransferase n=1 Tax=Spirosoma utsteinense TaxID=2585773 RepID=A0ABR6W1W2_9BACT|nr:geranylgeranylglycerol-phosphate geranylgeranyltransferase [Spirosoma utsteinense]MBC3789012.1 4-hydroxybenzoate polyprenyltransferase [Spirosoma utsteinense]MBC3790515.1 4-hydroxybenzoate polyprenyltransferase [Spirosoma utsteinense]